MLDLSLDAIGADSLVAVDIRSWFLKESGANVPVLRILDSSSVRELLIFAQSSIPPEIIPNVQGGTERSSNAAALSSATTTRESEPPTNHKTDSSSDTTPQTSAGSSDSIGGEITPKSSDVSSEEDEDGASKLAEAEKSHLTTTTTRKVDTALERVVPVSFAQSRFWFLKHYVQDQTAFNITTVIRLKGQLRVDALERALVEIGQRHEALRTLFFVDEKTKEPKQAVLSKSLLRLEQVAISGKHELDQTVSRAKEHVFNIERGEALRIQLLSSSDVSHWIILSYHHIYMDGIGYVVFLSDWEKAYNGLLEKKPSGMLQYPDFAQRQIRDYQTGAWSDELSFWRGQFPDLPRTLPLLPLTQHSARPDNAASSFGSHSTSFRIDEDLEAEIGQVSRRFNVTPFHLHLAVFHVLLYRYTDVDDLCIGIADGNRKDADIQRSLGLFLDLLPIRLRRSGRDTFANALKDVRKATLAAFGNSRVPFDVLLNELDVPRVPSHSPLFQAFMNYRRNHQESRTLFGCEGELDIVATGQTDYDVSVDVQDLSSEGGGSIVSLEVRRDIYDQAAANTLAKSYKILLRQFVDNPAARVTGVALYSAEDIKNAIQLGRGELATLCPLVY